MTASVPLWATLVIAFGVALLTLIGVLVTQAVLRRNAKDTNRVTRENSQDTTAVAQQVATTDRSKSDRDLILQALELLRKPDDPLAHRQGAALLDGLARMPGLSPDDAVLVQSVTRPVLEPILEEGREVESQTGQAPEFYLTEE